MCRHLQSIKFYLELLYAILDWIVIKMCHYSTSDRYCCSALDEVQISQELLHDSSLKRFVGNVSAELSGTSEAEKNMLSYHSCIMLNGKEELQRNGSRL